MTDKIIPDDQDHLGDNPGAVPDKGRIKRSLALRVSVFGTLLVAVLMLVFWLVSTRASTEPTLKSRLQEQQRAFDQLSKEMNSLQQHRDAQAMALNERAMQLDALLQRVEQLESDLADAQDQKVSVQIDALTTRLDELAAATDVRFSAVFEKQATLEGAIETVDAEADMTEKPTKAQPQTAERRPTPPSPPFTITGLERRGGRSYLGVTSGDPINLNDIRLISEGDSLGPWHLTAINSHSAAFSVNGQRVVVPTP